MEILEKLKNFLAPVDEEVIFDDGYAKAEDAVASAGQQTQSVSSQQVVGGESINVNSVDTNPFAKVAMNRQNMRPIPLLLKPFLILSFPSSFLLY